MLNVIFKATQIVLRRSLYFLRVGKGTGESEARTDAAPCRAPQAAQGHSGPAFTSQQKSFPDTVDRAVITDTRRQEPKLNTVHKLHFAFPSVCLVFGNSSDTFWTK